MRYWKGAYDEDSMRDLELRRSNGGASSGEEREIKWFHLLVAVQVVMLTFALFSVAELLWSSR